MGQTFLPNEPPTDPPSPGVIFTQWGFEELSDSPQITLDRDSGGTAVRRWKGPWANASGFGASLLPLPSDQTNPNLGSIMPGYWWLLVNNVKIEPFIDNPFPGQGEEPAQYEYALVTASYRARQAQQNAPVGQGGDGNGPGGDKGSTDGVPAEWIEHSLSIGAEFMTLADSSVIFDGDKVPAPNVHAGLLLPIIEHQIKVKKVLTPPWWQIRNNIGLLTDMGQADEGAVLFIGAEAEWQQAANGMECWNLSYKFSEKPQSWNMFWHPKGGGFKLLNIVGDGPIYKTGSFLVLFDGLTYAP
jgi:hypothetical protein